MNTTLGGCIDSLETERGNTLEGQRARREQRAVKAVKARMKASSFSKTRPASTRRAKKSCRRSHHRIEPLSQIQLASPAGGA